MDWECGGKGLLLFRASGALNLRLLKYFVQGDTGFCQKDKIDGSRVCMMMISTNHSISSLICYSWFS